MIYQWSNYLIDTTTYCLMQDGHQLELEPGVYDLLLYLIEQRHRVVTRDELLSELWQGRIVSDNTINARLKAARKAVGDSGRKQAAIKTIHGRGYQFIAPIVKTDAAVTTADNNQDTRARDGIRHKPSIGVVRFANLSSSPELKYFAYGVSANVWSGLARVPSLIVKSAPSIDLRESNLSEVVSYLQVDYLVSGSVQREGDHVRVNAELIDGKSGETLWSEKFDRYGTDAIEIQDDISKAIIASLWRKTDGQILEAELAHLSKKLARDFDAYDFILKGICAKEEYSKESNLQAHYYFNQAKSIEPDNAEALAWSAIIHCMDVYLGLTEDIQHSCKQAKAEASRALSLEKNSEAGHWAMGFCYSLDQNYDKAIAEFDLALKVNPCNPDSLVCKGTQQVLNGDLEGGIATCLEAISFSPEFPEWYLWELGTAYFYARQYDAAIETFDRMSEQNNDTRTFLTASYGITGKRQRAADCLQAMYREDPLFSLERVAKTYAYLPEKNVRTILDGLEVALEASTEQTVVPIER